MSDATNALLELRAKIEENKRLLQRQEEALAVMEEMMGMAHPKTTPQTKPLDISSAGIDIESLNFPVNSSRKTFKQEVISTIKLLGEQEFSVPVLHAALGQMGVSVNGLQPRARIAKVLNELVEEKLLTKTFEGKGSVPNQFKATRL